MNTFPDSCFVLMSQAECTPEALQPISTLRENNILSSDEIDATEKITVGQANRGLAPAKGGQNNCLKLYRVITKVESMKVSEVESMKVSEENSADKLVDRLLGKAKPPKNLPALKRECPRRPREITKMWHKHGKLISLIFRSEIPVDELINPVHSFCSDLLLFSRKFEKTVQDADHYKNGGH